MELFTVGSGSSGNCTCFQYKDTQFLIDAGLSGKRIQQGLAEFEVDPTKLKGILVSHEHNDHILGVGVLARRFNLPIYITEKTFVSCQAKLGKIESNQINFFEPNDKFQLGDVKIKAFSTHHDAVDPVGFSIYAKAQRTSILTDTGMVDEIIMDSIYDSDTVIIESNHDEKMVEASRYPWSLKKRILGEKGHLSNKTAADVLLELLKGKTKRVLLGHLSQENNFPQLAKITVENALKEKKEQINNDYTLEVLPRGGVSPIYR
ncbi:MBL fold metallo-hydrolase [Proteinivorax hydrogeniformans]|uniref:MBL fold metallo-hydrolase n=1 Tax=Proteinivorax hydrogeniformans TaxID=1826727 RepID=A0AAU8HTZ4_9FIRM